MLLRLSNVSRPLSHLAPLLVCALALSGCTTEWHLDDQEPSKPSTLTITRQPSSQTVAAETSATFTVVATGSASIDYQWYEDGQAISGATSASYTVQKSPYLMNGSLFAVKVSAPSATLTSQTATLNVNPLVPDLQLAPIQAHTFGDPSFSVSAVSPSNGGITYAIVSGPATISGSMVTLTGPGNVVVGAMQVASGDYTAAETSATFVVEDAVEISSITPANQTIAPGRQTFRATVRGGSSGVLRWTATSGSFAGDVWTSPDSAGKYTITATSADDPTKSASTSITISPPVIIKQPANLSACTNGPVTLSVDAIYDRAYQWKRNGVPLPGATASTYFVPAADASLDAGEYTVSVSNPAGRVTSQAVAVSVGSSIVSNPSNVSVATDQTASFSVVATGMAPFTYQWYRVAPGTLNGLPVAAANSESFTTPNLSIANDGDRYYALVTDSCGTILTSTSATLSVHSNNVPPSILTQPTSQTVSAGGTAAFNVIASGTPTLNYQWYRIPVASDLGIAIPGATAPGYTLPASATSIQNDQDSYYVTVTNNFGEATSLPAVLAIAAGITITKQPSSVNINAGEAATFAVSATSVLPLSYQWYQAAPGSTAFVAIPSATSSAYTLPSAVVSASGSTYYVIVSNGVTASVQSATAALFVGQLSGVSSCPSWNLIASASYLGNCSYQLTESRPFVQGLIVWPTLISTANLQLSFTITTSDASPTPADGFAVLLGDPSLGATLTSIGIPGEGLAARGIPGLVIAFDDFENGDNGGNWPQDPQVPYIGIGRGEDDLWERPYFLVKTNIPALADPSGQIVSHDYLLHIINGHITIAMDGTQVLSGDVSVPPVAYLYATASTGASWETTIISNISAIASPPSP
jgi:hypothetical protein